MPTLDTMPDNDRHSALVYGGPKTSKTLTVAKLAEFFKLEWFDLEHGRQTILSNFHQNANGCKSEWLKNINMFAIPDSRENPIAIDTIIKVLSGQRCRICWQHGRINCAECVDFKTLTPKPGKGFDEIELNTLPKNHIVVIDSGTQLTASALNHVTKGKEVGYQATIHDWRKQGALLTLVLMALQAGSYNAILITHDIVIDTDTSGVEDKHNYEFFPAFGTQNLSRTTAKYFDHVIYTDISNGRHVMDSSSLAIPNVVTGSRANVDLRKEPVRLLNAIFNGQVEKENVPLTSVKV